MRTRWLLCALVALSTSAANAQSLNDRGVARLNQDAQTLWTKDGLELAREQAEKELRKLVGVPHQVNKKTTATITRINSITIDCPVAPGLKKLDGTGCELRVPLTGEWRLEANVDLYVKGRLLGIKVDRTYQVNVELSEISADLKVKFDSSDLSAPKLVHAAPPLVHFKLKIKTSSWVLNFLSWLTRSTVNGVANSVAMGAGLYAAVKFHQHPQGNPEVIGAGGPPLAPVAPANLDLAATRLEDEIFDTKMPYGSVWEPDYVNPFSGTWEDSVNDPSFAPGALRGFQSIGDSANMTGDQLSGLAYRYAVTKEQGTLRRINTVLGTVRSLLTMKGEPGNLNRTLMPRSSPFFKGLSSDEYLKAWNGDEWVMSDYISRDAYKGIFYGLSLTYDLVDNPSIRDEIQKLLEMALDYLLRNDWTWRKRDGSFGERWQGVLEHQWAWVNAAWRINPTKYAVAREAHKGYADLLWVGIWGGCLDPYYSYYKFNLAHGGLFVGLRTETDPTAWMRAYQGIAIMRHFIGHHENAQFKSYYIGLDPSALAAQGPEVKNLLTRWLRRPRRYMIHDLTNDPTIQKTTYKVPFDPNLLFPGQGVPQNVLVSKYPVPVERRISTGYAWSSSPYKLTGWYGAPNPNVEGESLDYVEPYWMARYYRVLP